MEQVSVIGRNTQGVRMIRLDENDLVSDIAPVIQSESEENEEEPESSE